MKDKNISNVCLYYLGGNMYKLLRFYNQNRKKLWFIVVIIVFVLIIIQLLNSVAKQQNEEKIRQTEINKNQETTLNNVVSYDKQSEAIISNDNVSRNVRNINGKLLDEFFTYYNDKNKVYSYQLDYINKAGTSNSILRDVLGIDSSMPNWAEETLKSIIEKYSKRDFNEDNLKNMRDELSEIGLGEYIPSTIAHIAQGDDK